MTGRWRIVEMDLRDRDAIDLVGPGLIEFLDDGTGRFAFIVVDAYSTTTRRTKSSEARVHLGTHRRRRRHHRSRLGQPEADDSLRGHIYFHNGDDSGFRAARQDDDPHATRERSRTSSRRMNTDVAW